MKNVFCVLINPDAQIPMPGTGGRLFSQRGETINRDDPFWARLIADGDIKVSKEPLSAGDPRLGSSGQTRGEDDGRGKASGKKGKRESE